MKYVLAALKNYAVTEEGLIPPQQDPVVLFFNAFGGPADVKRMWSTYGVASPTEIADIETWVIETWSDLRGMRNGQRKRQRSPPEDVRLVLVCHDSYGEKFIELAGRLWVTADITTHFLGFVATIETDFTISNRLLEASPSIDRAYHAYRRLRGRRRDHDTPLGGVPGGDLGRSVRQTGGYRSADLYRSLQAIGYDFRPMATSPQRRSGQAPASGRFDEGVFYSYMERQEVYGDLRHAAREADLPFVELGGTQSPEEIARVAAYIPKPRQEEQKPENQTTETEVKPVLQLHFLRYGYFPKDIEYSTEHYRVASVHEQYDYAYDETHVDVGTAPDLEHFYTARTSLNEGYVYAFDASAPTGANCHEFRVRKDSIIEKIRWGGASPKSDVRTEIESAKRWMEVEEGEAYYVAYARYQWSAEYIESLRSNSDKLSKRMRRVSCDGIPMGGGSAGPHVVGCGDVYAVHHKDNRVVYSLHRYLRNDSLRKGKREKEAGCTVYGDMFLTLDDPLGCADDIQPIIEEKLLAHEANVEAMRFGVDPKRVLPTLGPKGRKHHLTTVERERADMFSIAQTTYQIVYSNPENIASFDGGGIGLHGDHLFEGNGVYKPRLLNVLGVEERREDRKAIRVLQRDFSLLIRSPYYARHLDDVLEGGDLCSAYGKPDVQAHVHVIVRDPYDYDYALDLKKEREHELAMERPWDQYLLECFEIDKAKDRMQETLLRDVVIDGVAETATDEVIASLATKAALFATQVTDHISRVVKLSKQPVEKVIDYYTDRLNSYGGFETRPYRIQPMLDADGNLTGFSKVVFDPDGLTAADRAVSRVIMGAGGASDTPLGTTEHGRRTTTHRSVGYADVVEARTPTGAAEKAKAFYKHVAFSGVVAAMQGFNMYVSMRALSEKPDARNWVNAFGVSAELTEAFYFVTDASIKRSGGEGLARAGASRMRFAGTVGAGITSVCCFIDATERCLSRDYDAGLANLAAGAMFAGLATSTWVTAATWAAWGGPPGWAMALIGFGCTYLTFKLKDSPLLSYFKSSMFSDYGSEPQVTKPAWEYNVNLYKGRNKLIPWKTSMPYLETCRRAAVKLDDLIVNARIEFLPADSVQKESRVTEINNPWAVSTTELKSSSEFVILFEVSVSFGQFLSSTEQFEPKVYFYGNGFDRSVPDDKVLVIKNKRLIAGSRETPAKMEFQLEVPRLAHPRLQMKSCVLLACRLNLSGDVFYPGKYDENERWIGAAVDLYHKENTFAGLVYAETGYGETKLAPLAELTSGSAFKD